MLIYDLAIVLNKGLFWEVVGVTKNSFDTIIDGEEKYLKLSSAAANIIKNALNDKKNVRIAKPISLDEVLPNEINIINNDKDELQFIKEATVRKARMLVIPEITKESGFTMYEFTIKNNELCSKGYFITDSNREEKYIEIIETGDDDLINLLESYLEAKDKIDRAYHLKNKYEIFKNKIKTCINVDEINNQENIFLEQLYSYLNI